jgi:hypothetical protein
MDEEESLRRFGVHPAAEDLDAIRTLLVEHTERERRAQGEGDTELMKLCCVQLFNSGDLDDALLVWNAKQSSFDAACSIDAALMLGRGIGATMAHLAADPAPSAAAALGYLRELEALGELVDFDAAAVSAGFDRYYDGS